MRDEILVLRARKEEAKRELERIEIVAARLVADVRMLLDPYADSVTELDLRRAHELMRELYGHWEEARRLKEKIDRITADLGE